MTTLSGALRTTIIALLFAIVFVPFVVSNSLFFPYITGKAFLFRGLVELAFLCYLILVVREPKYRPKKSFIVLSLGLFVGVLAVADIFGVNPSRSFWSNFERMEGLISHLHLLAYFVMLVSVFTEDLWDWFLHAWVGAGAATALYGILQINGLLASGHGRIDATLGNPTYLAVFMLFSLFFLALLYVRRHPNFGSRLFWLGIVAPHALLFTYGLGLYMKALGIVGTYQGVQLSTVLATAPYKSIGFIFIYFVVSLILQGAVKFFLRAREGRLLASIYAAELMVLFGTILFATATRGSILGLIAGTFVAALLVFLSEWQKRSGERTVMFRVSGAVVGLAVAVPILFFAVRNSNVVQNNDVLVRFANISASEQTTQSRLIIWGMALQGFKEHPVLGWGQENFNVVFNKYYDPRLWPQEQWFDRAHSVLFDSLINAGILGLATYLSLFGALLYVLWTKSRFAFTERALITGLAVAYFIHNLVVFDNIVSQLVFLALLAWVHHESVPAEHSHAPLFSRSVRDMVTGGAVVMFLVAAYFVQIKPILAAQNLIDAITPAASPTDIGGNLREFKKVIGYNTLGSGEAREQLVLFALQKVFRSGADAALINEFFLYAKEQMDAQIAAAPSDARYPFFSGILLLGSGNPAQAVAPLEKAVSLSSKKQTMMFPLVEARLISHDFTKAVETAKQAFQLEPKFDEARLWYAAALITDHKQKEAEDLLTERFGSPYVTDERVLRAYQTLGRLDMIERAWKLAIEKDPTVVQSYFNLAQNYLEQRRQNEAINTLLAAKKVNPELGEQIDAVIKDIRAGKTSL